MDYLHNGGADILTRDMDLERRGLVLVGKIWGGEKMAFDEVEERVQDESQQGLETQLHWTTEQGGWSA